MRRSTRRPRRRRRSEVPGPAARGPRRRPCRDPDGRRPIWTVPAGLARLPAARDGAHRACRFWRRAVGRGDRQRLPRRSAGAGPVLAVRQGRGPADGGRRPDHRRLGRGGLGPSGPRDAVGRGVRSDGRGVGGGHARVVGWAGGGGRGRGRAGFPAAPRPRPPPAPCRRGGEHFDPGRPRVCLREHGQFGPDRHPRRARGPGADPGAGDPRPAAARRDRGEGRPGALPHGNPSGRFRSLAAGGEPRHRNDGRRRGNRGDQARLGAAADPGGVRALRPGGGRACDGRRRRRGPGRPLAAASARLPCGRPAGLGGGRPGDTLPLRHRRLSVPARGLRGGGDLRAGAARTR